jgi:hypothetical protein
MTQGAAHWLCHEGISAARLRVVYQGRPASIDATKVTALRAEGLGATEIAKRLKRARRRATGGAGRRVLTPSHDADVVSFRGQLQSLPKNDYPRTLHRPQPISPRSSALFHWLEAPTRRALNRTALLPR